MIDTAANFQKSCTACVAVWGNTQSCLCLITTEEGSWWYQVKFDSTWIEFWWQRRCLWLLLLLLCQVRRSCASCWAQSIHTPVFRPLFPSLIHSGWCTAIAKIFPVAWMPKLNFHFCATKGFWNIWNTCDYLLLYQRNTKRMKNKLMPLSFGHDWNLCGILLWIFLP